MGFILIIWGGVVLLSAFNGSASNLTQRQWAELAVGLVLILVGGIIMAIRGDDD